MNPESTKVTPDEELTGDHTATFEAILRLTPQRLCSSEIIPRWRTEIEPTDMEPIKDGGILEDAPETTEIAQRPYDSLGVTSASGDPVEYVCQPMANGWQYFFNVRPPDYFELKTAIMDTWKGKASFEDPEPSLTSVDDMTRMLTITKNTFQVHEWLQSAADDQVLDETMQKYIRDYMPIQQPAEVYIAVRRDNQQYSMYALTMAEEDEDTQNSLEDNAKTQDGLDPTLGVTDPLAQDDPAVEPTVESSRDTSSSGETSSDKRRARERVWNWHVQWPVGTFVNESLFGSNADQSYRDRFGRIAEEFADLVTQI